MTITAHWHTRISYNIYALQGYLACACILYIQKDKKMERARLEYLRANILQDWKRGHSYVRMMAGYVHIQESFCVLLYELRVYSLWVPKPAFMLVLISCVYACTDLMRLISCVLCSERYRRDYAWWRGTHALLICSTMYVRSWDMHLAHCTCM